MAIKTKTNGKTGRWMMVAALAGIAFFGSYAMAQAKSGSSGGDILSAAASSSTGGSGCCGGGAKGSARAGTAASAAATATAGTSSGTTAPSAADQAALTASSGGGCCGGGATAPPAAQAPKAAEIAGNVQKISVDVSKGYYDPSTIELKAGVPAEITFSQASGCTGTVQSQDLGFSEDLSAGPKTVKLPALKAGQYTFACGMNMVFGSIVVK